MKTYRPNINIFFWGAELWAYYYPAKVFRPIQLRQQNLPTLIQDIAWKARIRLCKRFRRLMAGGRNPNVAITAIVQELAAPSSGL